MEELINYFIDKRFKPLFLSIFMEDCGVKQMDSLMEEVAFEEIENMRHKLLEEAGIVTTVN